ncbi:MAG: hypothetical protein ACOC2M_00710 [bacterium]
MSLFESLKGAEPNARKQKLNNLLDEIQEDIEAAKMPHDQILSYQREKLRENGFEAEAIKLEAKHAKLKHFNNEEEKQFHDSLYEARKAAGLEVININNQ